MSSGSTGNASSLTVTVLIGDEALNWVQTLGTGAALDSEDRASVAQRRASVQDILETVESRGDEALRELAQRFGDALPESFKLSPQEIEAAVNRLPQATKGVLDRAAANIRTYGQGVMDHCATPFSQNRGDYAVGMDWRPVEKVGCYVPGGRYPLPSTALMTAVTAQVAGVQEIVITSPQLHDEAIYAGTLAGVTTFYQLGGAQAVAALAYGTETVEAVDMVVGPGNAYVVEAKRQLLGTIGIDMLAGPSEVVVIADEDAEVDRVALDLLAQAEHDPDARAYCFTENESLGRQVAQRLVELKTELDLPEFVNESLANSVVVVLPGRTQCIAASNAVAPEHLLLQVRDPEAWKPHLVHYGALFMGYGATVPYGDYVAGPNHTLPTQRTARFSGALNPMTFLRPQSWIFVPGNAPQLAADTKAFADIEGLTAHAKCGEIRCKN